MIRRPLLQFLEKLTKHIQLRNFVLIQLWDDISHRMQLNPRRRGRSRKRVTNNAAVSVKTQQCNNFRDIWYFLICFKIIPFFECLIFSFSYIVVKQFTSCLIKLFAHLVYLISKSMIYKHIFDLCGAKSIVLFCLCAHRCLGLTFCQILSEWCLYWANKRPPPYGSLASSNIYLM